MNSVISNSQNAALHILTLHHVGKDCEPGSTSRSEVYLLNAGQHFVGFGGSSSGLTARKTGSMIVRFCNQAGGWSDTEYALNDASAMKFWTHLTWRVTQGDVLQGPAVV